MNKFQTGNACELYKHQFTINADHWTVTDTESIPTGEIRSVDDSVMDLRNSTILGDVIDKVPGGGYDYNFCLTMNDTENEKNLVATVLHPTSGRYLKVFSNQPGIQFYTANFLPESNSTGVRGKNGSEYFKHAAFCLETQNYPNAINHVSTEILFYILKNILHIKTNILLLKFKTDQTVDIRFN